MGIQHLSIPNECDDYEGWNCNKLRAEQKFVEDSLVQVSADQDSAATTDIWMVVLIGVPTSVVV